MEFKLLKIYHNEYEALLVKGNLENEGIKVKYNSASSMPTKFPHYRDEFGLYVSENDMEKANQILNLLPKS